MSNSSRLSAGRATSSSVQRLRMPAFTRTVRFRLTVWYSSLLLVFGVAFVVALNVAARLDQPEVTLYGETVNDIEWQPIRSGPGNAITGFQPVVTPRFLLQRAEDQIYANNIERLRVWSLISVFGLALASGVGGYVLSGMMLRPVRDITEVASEISASNLSRRINHQGPEDELWALAQTFDSMIDRLETSFRKQGQFVQDASHELRTPLAAIRTNIEVIESDPDATMTDYYELIDTVKAQTNRLTHLSEDLLLLLREGKDTLEKEPVDLAAVGREVIHQLQPLAATRDVMLRYDGEQELELPSNADLLYRCVYNLVDNAIKYSGEGSTVLVRAEPAPDGARILVTDNGPGIAEEDRTRIFDRFYRIDKGRSRREGGNGLGLAIVQELVSAIGGRVSVESQVGHGATFTISLDQGPAARADT